MKELRKNLLLMSNGVSTGGIMLKVKVTSKGQVTIPKEIRDKLGIRPGEGLAFEEKMAYSILKNLLSISGWAS